MRSDADRVSDILTATAKIRERVTDSIDAFLGDALVLVWLLPPLQVIDTPRGVSPPSQGPPSRGRCPGPSRACEIPG